jgi:hypothetical protein
MFERIITEFISPLGNEVVNSDFPGFASRNSLLFAKYEFLSYGRRNLLSLASTVAYLRLREGFLALFLGRLRFLAVLLRFFFGVKLLV